MVSRKHRPRFTPSLLLCRALAECAEAEGRVVLTADGAFVGGGYCEAAFHVTGGNKREQLHEVPPPRPPRVLPARASPLAA